MPAVLFPARSASSPSGELAAYADLGCRGDRDALIPRLVRQVLALPVSAPP